MTTTPDNQPKETYFEPVSLYDGTKFIPIIKVRCAHCNHETAYHESQVNYIEHYKYMRYALQKVVCENVQLKKANEYMKKELEQFRKATV